MRTIFEPLVTESETTLGASPTSLRRWRREARGPVNCKMRRTASYRCDDLTNFAVSARWKSISYIGTAPAGMVAT